MRRIDPRCFAVLAAFLATALFACIPIAEAQDRDFGRTTHNIGERTTAGNWDGTWIYRNRDQKIAIWIRTVDGLPQAKLRMIMNSTAETFETGWDGMVSYIFKKANSSFAMPLEPSDENQIRGSWNWMVDKGSSSREEVGTFELYRVDAGRNLVMEFDSFEKIYRRGDEERSRPSLRILTFDKVSRRMAQWDELPF